MAILEEITQTIHEANNWNPIGFLANNALLVLFILGFGLLMLWRFISTPKKLFR
jgi:hypothetical protein